MKTQTNEKLIREYHKPEILEKEINSERFIKGLEKAIEITLRTGYETSFEIYKRLLGTKVVYPFEIEIGDKKSVGVFVGNDRAKRNYEKRTGKEITDKFDPDVIVFSVDEDPTFEFYPDSKFLESPKEFPDNFYPFINVHTHPGGNIRPSLNDLKQINHIANNIKNEKGVIVRPVSIIVGVLEGKEKYPILIFQETKKSPENQIELEKSENNFLSFFQNKNFRIGEQTIRMLHFGLNSWCGFWHNKARAEFDPKERKINFDYNLKYFYKN